MERPATILLALLAPLIAAHGCAPHPPSAEGLDDQKFVEAYVALLERSAPPDSARSDSSSSLEQSELFAKLGTSEEAFRKKIESYRIDPQGWKIILEEVVRRLEAKMRGPVQASPN